MIKKWKFFEHASEITENSNDKMGYCYVARFKVMNGFYLTKIGATKSIKTRLQNIPNIKILAISPAHLNYYENEDILHKFFSEYRVPRKPSGKSQVELFNIDLPYFFRNIPDLTYEINEYDCQENKLPSGFVWYKSKNSS